MDSKEISIALSIFVIIASAIGIFSITDSEGGITGFNVFETTKLGNLGIGFAFFMILLIAIIVALVNLAYLERIVK